MRPRLERERGDIRVITSLQNERVKLIRSLELRKARRETGLFVAEGVSLLAMARDAGWVPRILAFLAGSASEMAAELIAWARESGGECLEVSQAVLAKLAAKENPQTMLGVFEQRWHLLPDVGGMTGDSVWVALEAPRDPGNLGTIIRTTEAAGGSGVVLIGNSCDPTSREAVRATMGSIFNVPLARVSSEQFTGWLSGWRGDVVGTHLDAQQDFREVRYREPTLLLMGSEGPGLSDGLAEACTRRVKIPMCGRLDSLNLAVATGLMLYEIRRGALRL